MELDERESSPMIGVISKYDHTNPPVGPTRTIALLIPPLYNGNPQNPSARKTATESVLKDGGNKTAVINTPSNPSDTGTAPIGKAMGERTQSNAENSAQTMSFFKDFVRVVRGIKLSFPNVFPILIPKKEKSKNSPVSFRKRTARSVFAGAFCIPTA